MENAKPMSAKKQKSHTRRRDSMSLKRIVVLHSTYLGAEYIGTHAGNFRNMGGFWSDQDVKLREHLKRIFPNEAMASNSVALWSGKNLLLPLFIDRVKFLHSHKKVGFQLPDLSSTLLSANEYFEVWFSNEVNHLIMILKHTTQDDKT
jgi:hypothetical protein